MLPSSVKIGAHTFDVDETFPARHDGDCGAVDITSLKITVRKDIRPSIAWESFVHETLHAIRILNGTALSDENEEERVVQADGHLIFQFMKENPQVLKEIIAHNEIHNI